MTLATLDDLEYRLGRVLTDDEVERAQALLDDVTGSLQVYTGQKFEHTDYTLRARVKRGMVRLPQRPVHDVTTVADKAGDDISFEWDGIDRVYIDTICRLDRAPVQVVDIEYEAGPDIVPPAIVGIACNIVLRTLGVNPTETGMSQESIDGYAYTIGSVGGSGAYGILPHEARTLDAFRRPYGNIQVAI